MGKVSRWALVLAAGDGTRLHRLTTLGNVPVPKQFCLFNGGPSLLGHALRRAERVVPRSQVVTVVAADHRRWWAGEMSAVPAENVVVQPSNRGTAAGVLLPLLTVQARDPEAAVILVPSDHWVEQEEPLVRKIDEAFRAIRREPDAIVLLGVKPDAAETGYGWIVPGRPATRGLRRVEAFVEKPDVAAAASLLERGGVWNTFLVVARAEALLAHYERKLPGLLQAMREAVRAEVTCPGAIEKLYAELTSTDFSRDLMQGAEDELRLAAAPACGWTDLGTPERVASCAGRVRSGQIQPIPMPVPTDTIDLVCALAALPPVGSGIHEPIPMTPGSPAILKADARGSSV